MLSQIAAIKLITNMKVVIPPRNKEESPSLIMESPKGILFAKTQFTQ